MQADASMVRGVFARRPPHDSQGFQGVPDRQKTEAANRYEDRAGELLLFKRCAPVTRGCAGHLPDSARLYIDLGGLT